MKTIIKLAKVKYHNNNSYNAVQVEVDFDGINAGYIPNREVHKLQNVREVSVDIVDFWNRQIAS